MAAATDPALMGQIVGSFRDDTRNGLMALRRSAADGDADGVRKGGHALKGMCASVGAEGMRELSQRVEGLGAAGTVEGIGELIGLLERESHQAQSELDASLQEGA
jgi:HPt (histidine-containing phosphotransfer) domain-containing protein